MEDGKYWLSRAAEMRERAAQIKDPTISGGFRGLAEQYERLAEDGARWSRIHGPTHAPAAGSLRDSGRAA
ncbi:MAG TPA: hypothetical protein VGL83_10100 [Stellaceae bacterium]